jgi:hypothetical protein
MEQVLTKETTVSGQAQRFTASTGSTGILTNDLFCAGSEWRKRGRVRYAHCGTTKRRASRERAQGTQTSRQF